MKELRTEIEINASPDRVWDILTDFPAMGEWNPFIPSLEGIANVGERLTVRLTPPGSGGMTFKPTVIKVDAGKEFRWLGRLVLRGLFDGEHYFIIEPLDGGSVRFVHGELMMGILVPLVSQFGILKSTEAGFEEMNHALKERAESG